MRLLSLFVKIILFLVLLAFAFANADSVAIHYFPGRELQAPLVFALLVFFGSGVLFGVIAGVGVIARQRREILSLKRASHRGSESAPGAA
jgi:uncharacterized integral membrane protein